MDIFTGALNIGRLFGITIRVHVLFVLWAGMTVIRAGADWPFTLLWLMLLFGSVLCHEFGHCFGARAVGGEAKDILMWPLGGLAFAQAPMRPWAQFVTVACGPLVNLIFCFLGGLILLVGLIVAVLVSPDSADAVSSQPFAAPASVDLLVRWEIYVLLFMLINFLLLAFNLLPVFPLDGGQLFRTLLWRWMGLNRATLLAGKVGVAGGGVLAIIGVMVGMISLVFIGVFCGVISFGQYRAACRGLDTERFLSAGRVRRTDRRQGGLWSRMFRSKTAGPAGQGTLSGEERGEGPVQATERDGEAELERIRKKVAESGVQSLSYVERQRLERFARERHRAEDGSQRHTGD